MCDGAEKLSIFCDTKPWGWDWDWGAWEPLKERDTVDVV